MNDSVAEALGAEWQVVPSKNNRIQKQLNNNNNNNNNNAQLPPRAPSPAQQQSLNAENVTNRAIETSDNSTMRIARERATGQQVSSTNQVIWSSSSGGGGGTANNGGAMKKIKSSNSWDALRNTSKELGADEDEDNEDDEDEDGDDERRRVRSSSSISANEEDVEKRRKRKERKKMKRMKMKLSGSESAFVVAEGDEYGDAVTAEEEELIEYDQEKRDTPYQSFEDLPTVSATEEELVIMKRNASSGSLNSNDNEDGAGGEEEKEEFVVEEEEEGEEEEEWIPVESKRKKGGMFSTSTSANNLAKMALLNRNNSSTDNMFVGNNSYGTQSPSGSASKKKNKKKKNKNKSSENNNNNNNNVNAKKKKKHKNDMGESISSGYSSEAESPTDSSFSASTPCANSSQENIAQLSKQLTHAHSKSASRLNMNDEILLKTPEKKETTAEDSADEIAQMIARNQSSFSDLDAADDAEESMSARRRREHHEREKSSTRFPSTEKLIVLPPNLSSSAPKQPPSSPSSLAMRTRKERESDDSVKITALRRQLSSASRQQQIHNKNSHHGHTASMERTFSEDLPLVPGRWAHFVNKMDEWVYFFTDVFWKSLGAFLSTILNWFRGGTSKKTEEAQRRARANLKRIRKENSSQNLLHQQSGRTPTYTSGSDAGYLTPPYLPPMPSKAAQQASLQATTAAQLKTNTKKNQKNNYGLDNRAILNPYLGCFGGAGDRAPNFRKAVVPEEDPFAHNELISCVDCSKTNVLPNAKIVATGGWDGTIRSWRWNPNVGLSGGHSLSGHTDRVEFLSIADYSNAGANVMQKPFLCVSGGRDNTVRVWDLERSRETRKMYVFDAVTSGAVDWQSATIAVGSRSGALGLWDLNTGQKRASIRGHQNDVTCVISYNATSLDGAGLFVSGGADGVVKVWDPRQEVAAATMTGHRRRVFSVCAGPPGVIFAGDFSSSVKTHVLAKPTARPRDLPNAPRIDGCEAPISGLEYCSLPHGRSAIRGGGQPSGVLISTAAYFPPSQKSKETPLEKVANVVSTLLVRKPSHNVDRKSSVDHHHNNNNNNNNNSNSNNTSAASSSATTPRDLSYMNNERIVLETSNGGTSQASMNSSGTSVPQIPYLGGFHRDNTSSEDSDSDDGSDAPLGLLHVRCVDGQGIGLSGSLFGEREEGEVVLDSDVDVNGGYLYSLPGTEGLLTCAAMSSNEQTSEVSIFAGAASGAFCAWSQGGSLSGLEKQNKKPNDDLDIDREWMMHKTDGFWKSEFSESVDVGCEKYSAD
jgi:WD40 repeat protein